MRILITLLSLYALLFANIFDIKSYEANFKQTITNNSNKEILYKGKIYFKNNGNILWSYTEPIIKNVFINKNKVIIDEPELEQAIISNMDDDLNLIKILKESKKINNNTYENTINEITYTIKTYKNNLNAIFYKDEIENKVKIIFSNEKVNQNIDDKIFQFSYSDYYDIIRK